MFVDLIVVVNSIDLAFPRGAGRGGGEVLVGALRPTVGDTVGITTPFSVRCPIEVDAGRHIS